MPSQCVAWNCPTRRRGDDTDDQTVTFHSFPITRPDLMTKWLESMGETVWKPQRGSVLCSKHFERDCFLQNYATPRLKQGAIPTMFDKRPNSHIPVDLDKRTAHEIMVVGSGPGGPLTVANAWSQDRPRRRKIARRYDPEEEVANLRQLLEDERIKRRELEQEVFKLRQEKAEMSAKMNKLEASKCKPNIPQSLIPILVDAMSRGVDPLKRPDNRPLARLPAKTLAASSPKLPIKAPAAKQVRPIAKMPEATKTPPIKPAAVTPNNSAQKVVLQLPQQLLGSNGKTVSFLVPASGSSTPVTITPSVSVSASGNAEPASTPAAADSNGGATDAADAGDSEMTNEPSTSSTD